MQIEHGKYTSYGKHIAQELEELSPQMAVYCKKAIFQGQLGNLTVNSRIVNGMKHGSNNTIELIFHTTSSAKGYYSQYLSNVDVSTYSNSSELI